MEGEEDDDYPGPESGIGGINLNGRNVGAVMVAPRDVDVASQSGCRINIYVNSNVQGTCGSALLGSKVKLRDPGVHLHIEDLKMNRDDGSRQREMRLIKVGLCLVCLFNVFLGVILLLSYWLRKKTGSI
ncbi:Transmembrane protein [Hirschfeldia incana]|nr:Transmembrane protein [Hirschfeldia incana]